LEYDNVTTFWDRVAGLYDHVFSPRFWAERQFAIAQGVAGRTLEACCGTGKLTQYLMEQGVDVYAIDMSPRMVSKARERLASAGLDPGRLLVADVRRLPFSDESFDYVLVTGTLGLLKAQDVRTAIAEMYRLSRKEVRLLEPLEKQEGFYPGRIRTLMFDGMHPISKSVFADLGLDYHLEWRAIMDVFSYLRVFKQRRDNEPPPSGQSTREVSND
jgi:ubiquinone/menaquinone biosynthesis C-methylase UbiE